MDEHRGATSPDAGFSLVEVIVAMVLLAGLALVTLPLFMTGIRVAATSGARTTATDQVNAALEQLRAAKPTSCTDLQSKMQTVNAGFQSAAPADAQGRAFTVALSVTAPCANPATVTAQATRNVTGSPLAASTLATVTTIIYLTS